MAKILIDANKYLEFYQSTRISDLLGLLFAVKDQILVTEQIVHEVKRNRVNVALQFLHQSWEQKPHRYSVPGHLLSIKSEEVERLTKTVDEANAKSKATCISLSDAIQKTLKDIARGSDRITESLAELFAKSVKTTDEELARARVRKERGDPPGKRSDPLGDQISWEQFLSHINGEKTLWLITGDGDFRYKLPDKTLALNPLLVDDIAAATKTTAEVRCFETLTEGLSDASRELKMLPTKAIDQAELQRIKEEELAQAAFNQVPSITCPKCGGVSSWLAIRGAQGYFTQINFFTCPHCGAKFDSGGE